LDLSVFPPQIHKLHFVFDGWLGDAIVESFPCFVVAERAAQSLTDGDLVGFESGGVEVSASEHFRELHPGQELLRFRWQRIVGRAGIDDFGFGADHRLVLSERALACFQSVGMKNAVTQWVETMKFGS
jgi:hypothetical protein